jgi:predicted Ser/Thr protein kinase
VPLSDAALTHLRHVADLPDLTGTRYEVLEPLGRGGMGAVFRVRDRALDREAAMKVLAGAPSAESRARLEQEARVLARLEHPGIVPVHDVGTLPDGRLYYVMKLVRGDALDVAGPRIETVSERLRLLVRAADAVAFAHARGVVHRDLTPRNVMIGDFGEVLVVDWGLATVSSRQAGVDGDGVRAGTPGFMAPEQSRGVVDARSDVFALGTVLDWWLAPSQGGPVRLPGALRSIVAKARSADPADRYHDAAEFSADLARFLDGGAVSAHRESLLERVVRVGRRYRVAIYLVLGYLLMRIALLWYRGI